MKALITGVTGQDGYYLAQQLLTAGHEVVGTSRRFKDFDAELTALVAAHPDRFTLTQLDPLDPMDVLRLLASTVPAEVYHMAGLSHVGLSFSHPTAAYRAILDAGLILLEACAQLHNEPRVYVASSSEMFGNSLRPEPLTSTSDMRPVSPYGLAKLALHQAAGYYRRTRGLHVVSGIAFNHESTRRPVNFVSRVISLQAVLVARGRQEKVKLGNTAAVRDWGWAPEYTEGMSQLLRVVEPQDTVLCTGQSASVRDMARLALRVALKQELSVDEVDSYIESAGVTSDRAVELDVLRGDPDEALRLVGWRAKLSWVDVTRKLVEHDLREATHAS